MMILINSNLVFSSIGSGPPDQRHLDEGEGEAGEEEVIEDSISSSTSSNLLYLH